MEVFNFYFLRLHLFFCFLEFLTIFLGCDCNWHNAQRTKKRSWNNFKFWTEWCWRVVYNISGVTIMVLLFTSSFFFFKYMNIFFQTPLLFKIFISLIDIYINEQISSYTILTTFQMDPDLWINFKLRVFSYQQQHRWQNISSFYSLFHSIAISGKNIQTRYIDFIDSAKDLLENQNFEHVVTNELFSQCSFEKILEWACKRDWSTNLRVIVTIDNTIPEDRKKQSKALFESAIKKNILVAKRFIYLILFF